MDSQSKIKSGVSLHRRWHSAELAAQIAGIDATLARFKPFDDWCASAPAYARRFAVKHFGSMRATYDAMRSQFTQVRDELATQLNLIKGNHDGTRG